MPYLSWKDLDDEADEQPEGAPAEPEPAQAAAPELPPPTREALIRQVPGLSELVAERKQLERKMRGLLGQPEENESSERDRKRFPMVRHTPESRILDRRLERRDAETHLASQHALAEQHAEERQEEGREAARRRREAERVTRRRAAQQERLRQAEVARAELAATQVASRWQSAREAEQKARTLRHNQERGALDRLDLLRLSSQSATRREQSAERLREGLRRGRSEAIPLPLARKKADDHWARRRDLALDRIRAPERLIDDADRALEPRLRPLKDGWRQIQSRMDTAFEPPRSSGSDEDDAETREELREARKEMNEDVPLDDLDERAQRLREQLKEKAKEKVRALASEGRDRARLAARRLDPRNR